jgi:hypothetical protein
LWYLVRRRLVSSSGMLCLPIASVTGWHSHTAWEGNPPVSAMIFYGGGCACSMGIPWTPVVVGNVCSTDSACQRKQHVWLLSPFCSPLCVRCVLFRLLTLTSCLAPLTVFGPFCHFVLSCFFRVDGVCDGRAVRWFGSLLQAVVKWMPEILQTCTVAGSQFAI